MYILVRLSLFTDLNVEIFMSDEIVHAMLKI